LQCAALMSCFLLDYLKNRFEFRSAHLQMPFSCCTAWFSWAPQSRRMEPKFWPLINFVGHMDTVADDAERLLRQIGGQDCWNKYGAKGWGKEEPEKDKDGQTTTTLLDQDHAIFVSTSTGIGAGHATAAKDRLKMYYTPELERQVDQYCMGDYHVPVLNLTKREIYAKS
jgi:hypothetical protein